MEDEIDIEEHDVLDNPRVKNMFPDLARVKIEVPDEEDMEDMPEEPPETDQMLYQYDYTSYSVHNPVSNDISDDNFTDQYITNDYINHNQTVTDSGQDSYPEPEYMQFISCPVNDAAYEDNASGYVPNKIILGSKPSYEVLYREAMTSNAIVLLEDWADRIFNSPCYCDVCGTLFSTINALDAHKMVAHSYLVAVTNIAKKSTTLPVNLARKSTTAAGKMCNHCNVMFADDTALIKHLYELLPMSDFNVASTKSSQSDSFKTESVASTSGVKKMVENKECSSDGVQYRCIKCDVTFVTTYKARAHRRNVHGDMRGARIFKLIFNKSKIKSIPMSGHAYVSNLVAKSILFRCTTCNIHIISAYSSVTHQKLCTKLTKYHTCKLCHKKIIFRDIHRHTYQHQHTDRIKVYDVHKGLYERVLCKCPKCSVYFDELLFFKHAKRCSEVDYVLCTTCNVYIDRNRYKVHIYRHNYRKMAKKDFIFVEFHDQNDVEAAIRGKSANPSEPVDKSDSPIKSKHKNDDVDDKIVKTSKGKPKIDWLKAKIAASKLKPGKSKIGADVDGRYNMYYCHYCGCCQNSFKSRGHLNKSCLKSKYERRICELCGLNFKPKSYVTHIARHAKRKMALQDFKFTNLITGKPIGPPMHTMHKCKLCKINFITRQHMKCHVCVTEDHRVCGFCNEKYEIRAYRLHKEFHTVGANKNGFMPELLMKYNSLFSTWNILYMCAECSVVTVTYDAAVNHSHDHIGGVFTDSVRCKMCDLKINNACRPTHDTLHKQNNALNRKSFNILTFDYKNLFKDNWMDLFKGLSKQDINVILSKSVYRHVRSVKMNVSGSSDVVRYVCCICKITIDDIKGHIDSCCTHKAKYKCRYCSSKFSGVNDLVGHEGTHDKYGGDVKIVTFNGDNDKSINDKLRKYSNNTVKVGGKKFVMYVCSGCKVTIVKKHNMSIHRCITEHKKRYCDQCDCYFSYQAMMNHRIAHKKFPNLCKDTISITLFRNEVKRRTIKKHVQLDVQPSVDVKTVPKETKVRNVSFLYKCDCGLHFTSAQYVKKHVSVCGEGNISSEKCSKCNLLFPTDMLVTHLIKHHSNDTSKIVTKTVMKQRVYQCSECKVLCHSKRSVQGHVCDRNSGVRCSSCNERYCSAYLDKHKCQETAKDLYVIRVVTFNQPYKLIEVYNCAACDVNYYNSGGYRAHIKHKHHISRTPIKCEVCELNFPKKSYEQHLKVHVGYENYKINVINEFTGNTIVEGDNVDREKHIGVDESNVDDNAASKDDDATSQPLKDRIVFEKEQSLSDTKPKWNKKKYSSTLYKCPYCDLHFMHFFAVRSHKGRHSVAKNIPTANCDQCGIKFTVVSLVRHKKVHHEIMKLGLKDFVIEYDENDREIANAADNTVEQDMRDAEDVNTTNLVETDGADNTESQIDDGDNSVVSKLSFDGTCLLESGGQDGEMLGFDVTEDPCSHATEDATNTVDSDETANLVGFDEAGNPSSAIGNDHRLKTVDTDTKRELRLYKCGECNVCFMKQIECTKHVRKHVTIDPKMYIECKICGYQFMIGSLKLHMEKHHTTEFRTEKILIEEHSAVEDSSATRIDVYYATDRVQSRLVSTTTEERDDLDMLAAEN